MNPEYTQEQAEDIKARTQQASEYLKSVNLVVACLPSWEMKDGVYSLKLNQYLQDTKYTSMPSPIQP